MRLRIIRGKVKRKREEERASSGERKRVGPGLAGPIPGQGKAPAGEGLVRERAPGRNRPGE